MIAHAHNGAALLVNAEQHRDERPALDIADSRADVVG